MTKFKKTKIFPDQKRLRVPSADAAEAVEKDAGNAADILRIAGETAVNWKNVLRLLG
jgi:hypothetical protein